MSRTEVPINQKNARRCLFFFLSMCTPANDTRRKCGYVFACRCANLILGLYPQIPVTSRKSWYVCNMITLHYQRHDVYNTMWTTRSLFFADLITKTLWSFPDLIGYNKSLALQSDPMRFHISSQWKIHIYKEVRKIPSRHTAETKFSLHHWGSSERPSNDQSDNVIDHPAQTDNSQ